MYQVVRNTLGAAVLAGLAVLTWMLGRPIDTGEPYASDATPTDTGYYLRNATLFGTDAEGRIVYRLRAAQVNQPADGGTLRFEHLDLEYDPSVDVHWRLSARTGVAGETDGILHLSDGVRLESADDALVETTEIEVQSLTVDTASSTAQTNERVSLAHGRTRFEATGLTADLAHDRIDLHADVTAHLVP